MATKKTKKTTKAELGHLAATKRAGPVGVTLFFEGAALVAKLVKRVPGQNYKRAQTLIEEAFWRQFGRENVIHVPGSTKTHVADVTVSQADRVSASLSLHEDVISLVYSSPEEVVVPTPKKKAGHTTAVETLKSEIESLDRQIKVNKDDIGRFQNMVDKTQGFLDVNIQRRSDLIATIKALKA